MLNVAGARVSNTWLRFGACAIVAAVATSAVGNLWPMAWFAGLIPVLLADRWIFMRLRRLIAAGDTPPHLARTVMWTAVQSAYGNSLAILLWFSPYVPGETLAVLYLFAALANAAATMRASLPLSIAAAGVTVAFLLGLPLSEFLIGGARNPMDLMPLVGGLLLLAFGLNLWRSLLAADAARGEVENAVVRERQAAASAAAAKTSVIDRMNDELRTPMAALAGAAEHLHRIAQSQQARAHIATIVQANEVLKLVLNDLSDLDRLENGQLHIEAKSTNLRDVLRGVVSAFRAAAQDKNLELVLEVDPQTPVSVEVDAARVRQVLFNLLANAVRYTDEGGIRVRLTVQSVDRGRARLQFLVADTGVGISRSQLALLFGRERINTDGEGPGLGLSISLRLAKLMGGKLQAQSEPGEGSTFGFTLDAPITEPNADAHRAA